MAELLKRSYDLTALRISLDHSDNRPRVRLQLDTHGALSDPITFPAEAVKIPHDPPFEDAAGRVPSFSVPRRALEHLHQILKDIGTDELLWLLFTFPYGWLATVPWERLLAELGRPMLRIPNYAVPPVAAIDVLDIVLCVAPPLGPRSWNPAEMTMRVIEDVLDAEARRTMIHVFVDANSFAEVRDRLDDKPTLGPSVNVYDSSDADLAARTSESKRGDVSELSNPWLRWVERSLMGLSVDVLHFVCSGQYSADQGSLILRDSPRSGLKPTPSSLVGATHLSRFMTRMGAWALHLSAPDEDVPNLGLRMLADQISQLRPGPVTFNDMTRVSVGDLAAAYRFLYAAHVTAAPRSGGVSIYCHPGLLNQSPRWEALASDTSERVRSVVDQLTLAKGATLTALESNVATPTWVASSQRYLEQCTAELLEQEGSLPQPYLEAQQPDELTFDQYSPEKIYVRPNDAAVRKVAARRGAADALAFISGLIAEHGHRAKEES
jgi:hypothetical protein